MRLDRVDPLLATIHPVAFTHLAAIALPFAEGDTCAAILFNPIRRLTPKFLDSDSHTLALYWEDDPRKEPEEVVKVNLRGRL